MVLRRKMGWTMLDITSTGGASTIPIPKHMFLHNRTADKVCDVPTARFPGPGAYRCPASPLYHTRHRAAHALASPRHPGTPSQLPVSAYRLTPEILEKVERRTALDRQLYAAAQARLDRELAAIPRTELQAELRAWRLVQETLAEECGARGVSAACATSRAEHPEALCAWYNRPPLAQMDSCGYAMGSKEHPPGLYRSDEE